MATRYVDSNASGLDDGSSWANAYPTLQEGMTAWTTSDVVWVASDHSEAVASALLSSSGTPAAPCLIFSVSSSDDSYTPAPSAQLTDSGSMRFNQSVKCHGMAFTSTSKMDFRTGAQHYSMINCSLELTGAGSTWNIGVAGNNCTYYSFNTDYVYDASASYVYLKGAKFVMEGGVFTGQAHSNGIFLNLGTAPSMVDIIGTDFGAVDISTNSAPLITLAAGAVNFQASYAFCDLPASIVITPAFTDQAKQVNIISSDDAGALHRHERHMAEGVVVTTSSIYRDSGYTDKLTSTQVSHKMTSVTAVDAMLTLSGFPIMVHVDAT